MRRWLQASGNSPRVWHDLTAIFIYLFIYLFIHSFIYLSVPAEQVLHKPITAIIGGFFL